MINRRTRLKAAIALYLIATAMFVTGFFWAGHGVGILGWIPLIAAFRLYRLATKPAVRHQPAMDTGAARRESHALGLPFPEADGTLSGPPAKPPTDEQVHEQIHARRFAAQPELRWQQVADPCCPRCLGSGMVDGSAILVDLGAGRAPQVLKKACPSCVAKPS